MRSLRSTLAATAPASAVAELESLGVISRLLKMKKIAVIQFLGGILTFCLVACRPPDRTYSPSSTFTPGPQLIEFTENSVRVVVSLESDEQRRPLLRATFTPTEAGFHLYGKDLPMSGVQGIGLPTRLDIPQQSSVRPAGPSFADLAAHDLRFDALNITLPIYPEGPVTLRLPVELSTPQGAVTAQLAFTYMACQTNGQCRFPVKNKVVEAQIPKVQ